MYKQQSIVSTKIVLIAGDRVASLTELHGIYWQRGCGGARARLETRAVLTCGTVSVNAPSEFEDLIMVKEFNHRGHRGHRGIERDLKSVISNLRLLFLFNPLCPLWFKSLQGKIR